MIPSRVFFVTAPHIAAMNRIQRLVPTLAQGAATSVVIRANKSTVWSVLGILRPWPRFRTLRICFPTHLVIGRAAVRGTFLSLMLRQRLCNSADLCLRAQSAMKEGLFFNECFIKSVVKCEAASLSAQPEQFNHTCPKIELRQLQHSSGWSHFGTGNVCCSQVCEGVHEI